MSRRYPSDQLLTPNRPGPTILAQYAWRLLEAVPDIGFVKDPTGRYVYVNQAVADLGWNQVYQDDVAVIFRQQPEARPRQ